MQRGGRFRRDGKAVDQLLRGVGHPPVDGGTHYHGDDDGGYARQQQRHARPAHGGGVVGQMQQPQHDDGDDAHRQHYPLDGVFLQGGDVAHLRHSVDDGLAGEVVPGIGDLLQGVHSPVFVQVNPHLGGERLDAGLQQRAGRFFQEFLALRQIQPLQQGRRRRVRRFGVVAGQRRRQRGLAILAEIVHHRQRVIGGGNGHGVVDAADGGQIFGVEGVDAFIHQPEHRRLDVVQERPHLHIETGVVGFLVHIIREPRHRPLHLRLQVIGLEEFPEELRQVVIADGVADVGALPQRLRQLRVADDVVAEAVVGVGHIEAADVGFGGGDAFQHRADGDVIQETAKDRQSQQGGQNSPKDRPILAQRNLIRNRVWENLNTLSGNAAAGRQPEA